jgi:hypothetical protein
MPEHAVSHGNGNPSFNLHAVNDTGLPRLKACPPSDAQQSLVSSGIRISYNLHRKYNNPSILLGTSVINVDGLCPEFDAHKNTNLFGHHFGIKFIHDGHTYVWAISPFKFVSWFCLTNNLTYKLSHTSNIFCMDAAIPAITSSQIFELIYERCIQICCSNFKIYEPHTAAAPAAHFQLFLNGAVGAQLPSHKNWVRAYCNDPKLSSALCFVENLGTISQRNLNKAKLNANYCQALRSSDIKLENRILIYCEPIARSEYYARLQLVPTIFQNIIFVAFHSNLIGGHLNVSRTLHHIRLRFYWPGMFLYIKKMCASCPGCAVANPTHGESKELLYNFPIKALFLVLHINGYQAGKESGFEGSLHYLVACCGMCTFVAMEPVSTTNATTYASAIMKIMLRFGFCHNKDSKFYGVCCKALDFLKVNHHVLSGGNHIVECLNPYLNAGLRIMTNERNSTCIALEAILLLINAWNLCPVPGTDISRSMVAIGRKFTFPIDFSTGKHAKLYSTPGTIESYSRELAIRLSSCREITDLLVLEHQCRHRNLVNSRRHNPRIFSDGDIVFDCQAMCSNTKHGHVDKLMHPFTGLWRVVQALPGMSCKLKFAHDTKQKDKKHASNLCPYPAKLIPFEPLDGTDNHYG